MSRTNYLLEEMVKFWLIRFETFYNRKKQTNGGGFGALSLTVGAALAFMTHEAPPTLARRGR